MESLKTGFTYAFKRNIGWQDKVIRTIVGISSVIGVFFYLKTNRVAAIALEILAIAQVGPVVSARCIICYFIKRCTITTTEKSNLTSRRIEFGK